MLEQVIRCARRRSIWLSALAERDRIANYFVQRRYQQILASVDSDPELLRKLAEARRQALASIVDAHTDEGESQPPP